VTGVRLNRHQTQELVMTQHAHERLVDAATDAYSHAVRIG
jgi:hypothetical protein